MSSYFECWVGVAGDLFHQALAGEPDLIEPQPGTIETETSDATNWFGASAALSGDENGTLSVFLDGSILDAPLLGEGVEQKSSWAELLRETFEAACGELLAKTGKKCRVERMEESAGEGCGKSNLDRTFLLRAEGRSWKMQVRSELNEAKPDIAKACDAAPSASYFEQVTPALGAGLELLLDVELEASLRFGCREMPLGEILDLGPGDVVQLDRHVADPVDLIVGDKIVARGEVVLVNGNFGLRISEVATPKKRLESIRCLF